MDNVTNLRTPNGQFQRGTSGNPGGRPRALRDIQALATQHSEAAIAKLAEIMNSPEASHSVQIEAAKALLERAHGKPTQPLEHSEQSKPPTPTELRAMADELEAIEKDPFIAGIVAARFSSQG